jgi:phosphodiester glycosidase
MRPFRGVALGILVLARADGVTATELEGWRLLGPGLEVGEFRAPHPSDVGDSRIVVVRIDPRHHEFRLLNAKGLGRARAPTVKEWVESYGLVGAINASMYREDHLTSVAFMRNGDDVNNERWTMDKAVFAAGPDDPSLPEVQIIDRSCQDLEGLKGHYRILAQNIRMLDCAGRNTWAPQDKRWSTASVGTDDAGRVLFIHCRSPFSTHDFIDILRALPLRLQRLMYVEGGPEASLFVRWAGKDAVSRVGSFETGFRLDDLNQDFWPLPNVIGFVAKAGR